MGRFRWSACLAVALALLLTGCPSPEATSGRQGTPPGGPAALSQAPAQREVRPREPAGARLEAGAETRRLLREFEGEMDRLPGPPPKERSGNVIVVLERYSYDEGSSAKVTAAWRYADERIVTGEKAKSLWARNGLRLGMATEEFRGALGLGVRSRRRQATTRMMLTLMSGSEASLAAGTDVYVPRLRVWTWAGWGVLFEREFVGSSLVVAAEVVGEDRIRLTLFPRFSSRSGRSIDVTDLRTEVVVPHGETLAIGGLEERGDSLAFALFGVGGGERRGRMLLLVTPYIEAAKPAKAGGAPQE